jgi:methanethiol S-methyltransferase
MNDQPVYLSHFLLCAAWMLFALIHHVTASEAFKDTCQRKLGDYFKYYRLFYCLTAFVTLAAVLILQFAIISPVLQFPGWMVVALSVPAGATGIALMHTCLYKYFYRLSGIAVLAGEKDAFKLETTGVHKHVRHPLYLGTLLFIWSLFLIFPLWSNLVACASITSYVLLGINSEEKKLVRTFGEDYKRYQRTTPKLIPRIIKMDSNCV